ncbi:hypothetical protein [Nocardia shimofusensis]|uniref:hypothetical protein n=1 Tax=Nocardia shimofusensis TaxID=228596 RepID=UPI000A6528CF|nr:hypothetical protein [Nocardia shimofusensis]
MSVTGGVRTPRLGVVDEIFLRGHKGLGTPNVLQGLWRTADRVEPDLLRRLHAVLRTGDLGRRVVRSRVPGARPAWRPNQRAHPLVLASAPLTVAQALTWADGQGADLDPEFGPGWRLSATPLDDGGTIIALTCSHVIADARGLVLAASRALARLEADGTNAPGDSPSTPARAESEWRDAVRQWSIVVGGTLRAVRGLGAHPVRAVRDAAPDRDGHARAAGADDPLPVHSVAAQCEAAIWDRVAAEHDGTANSLFIQLVAETLRTAGAAHGFTWAGIEASLPVDTRDEPRVSNDIAVTSVVVDPLDTPATLRAKARAAYEHRMSGPAGVPEEILQVVGDRLAHRMAAGAGERDILCSNIGDLPEQLSSFGPHRCLGVAARAIHPGLTVGTRPRTRLSGYLCRIGADYTLCLVALDPPGIDSPDALAEAAARVASTLGLSLSFW